MSTRSSITAKISDGTYKSVYCHFDGYPSNNGRILMEHYTDQAKIDALLEPGDMSSLGERCDKPDGHSYQTPVDDCTLYYGRDRGENEDDIRARTGATAEEALGKDSQEYNYLWDGESWTCDGEPIADAVTEDEVNFDVT